MAIEDFLTVAAPTDEMIETDAVVVGAGPVGLFQVFELGLLEIKCHVIDSLRTVGGQCMELYPTKPIYDIPAVPVCSSYELTENLLKQNHHFAPVFHLGEEVTDVKKLEDGTFHVTTSAGSRFHCKVVIIAAGVGSFQPRPLRVKGIEKFEGTQLHYSCKDPSIFDGKNVVILGGGDSALDWTLNLVGKAESVVLVHRRDGFRAQAASVARMKELCENWEMQFEVGQVTGFTEEDGKLTEVAVSAPTASRAASRSTISSSSLVFSRSSAPLKTGGSTLSASRSSSIPLALSQASPASSPWATSIRTPGKRSSFSRASMNARWLPLRPATMSSLKSASSSSTRRRARSSTRCSALKRRPSTIKALKRRAFRALRSKNPRCAERNRGDFYFERSPLSVVLHRNGRHAG